MKYGYAPQPCFDCGVNTSRMTGIGEYFVVRHDLWASVAPARARGYYLCVRCLEIRLRRRLTVADFLPCPANTLPGFRSARLRDRLGALCRAPEVSDGDHDHV